MRPATRRILKSPGQGDEGRRALFLVFLQFLPRASDEFQKTLKKLLHMVLVTICRTEDGPASLPVTREKGTLQRHFTHKAKNDSILRCAVLVPEWVRDFVKSHHLHLLSAASVQERLESVFHWAPVLEAWDLGA